MTFQQALTKAIANLDSEEFFERVKEEDSNMLSQIPIIKQINELGYLTIDSQAGNLTEGKLRSGINFTIMEKSYVQGFMPADKASKFVKLMNIVTDKIALVIPTSEDNLSASFDIPLTMTISDSVEINTHMSTAIPPYLMAEYKKELGITSTDAVLVLCYSNVWNEHASSRNGLFKVVKKTLQKLN